MRDIRAANASWSFTSKIAFCAREWPVRFLKFRDEFQEPLGESRILIMRIVAFTAAIT